MPRIFPRPVESAVRVLKRICDDSANSTELRARSAELLLAAYGYTNLLPDEEPRHRTVRQITVARVKVSELDRQISKQVSDDRKVKSALATIRKLQNEESQ